MVKYRACSLCGPNGPITIFVLVHYENKDLTYSLDSLDQKTNFFVKVFNNSSTLKLKEIKKYLIFFGFLVQMHRKLVFNTTFCGPKFFSVLVHFGPNGPKA